MARSRAPLAITAGAALALLAVGGVAFLNVAGEDDEAATTAPPISSPISSPTSSDGPFSGSSSAEGVDESGSSGGSVARPDQPAEGVGPGTSPAGPATSPATLATPQAPVPIDADGSSGGLVLLRTRFVELLYPGDWVVTEREVFRDGTPSVISTVVRRVADDPHTVVRVDTVENDGADAIGAADRPRSALRDDASFVELDYYSFSYSAPDGREYQAVYWAFLLDHPDTGVLLHNVDVVISDGEGNTTAVLVRAPEGSAFDGLRSTFDDVLASIDP